MSGMGWDDNFKMIVMGEAEYIEYIIVLIILNIIIYKKIHIVILTDPSNIYLLNEDPHTRWALFEQAY